MSAVLLAACGQEVHSTGPITSWNGERLNEFQLTVVGDDGVVTEAELNDAYERARQCVQDDGWQALLTTDQFGAPALNIVTGRNDDAEAGTGVMQRCESVWVGQLKSIYLVSNAPTGAERETEFAAFRQCIEATGGETDGIFLGQEQGDMLGRIEELSGPYLEWPPERLACIDTYYAVLWPEMLGSPG